MLFVLAGDCSAALDPGIGAAPVVAGMCGGRVQILPYRHIQGLSILTFCWI